jgi:hypothetical protein
MTKRRPTIKGRGAEILFGEPSMPAIEPLVAEVAETLGIAPEDEADLEKAIYEEAYDGEAGESLGQEGENDLAVLLPELETALAEEATAAEGSPRPAAETPIPTLEAAMDETEPGTEAAIHQPPSLEIVEEATGRVVPTRPSRLFVKVVPSDTTASADVQPPATSERTEVDQSLTEEEQRELLARLGGARLAELDQEIDRTYSQVLEVVGDNEDVATECYNLLLKARDIIWRREAARIAQAEYYIEQAQARLKRAERSRRGEKRYAWLITLWGGVWALAFIAALILLGQEAYRNIVTPTPSSDSLIDMRIFVPAMIWGGIGGVTAVWYSLFKHVGRRDFDTSYNLSYIAKPFLGIILGATVYMLLQLVLRTIGVVPAGLQGGAVDMPTVAPWLVYLVAWAGGFKENRVFDLVDKVMKQIFSGKESSAAATPEEAPPTR